MRKSKEGNIGGRWIIRHAKTFGEAHIRHAAVVHHMARDAEKLEDARLAPSLGRAVFPEALKDAVFRDIMEQGAGSFGGSFHLDGRPVDGSDLPDTDTWCVGAGHPSGVTLTFGEVLGADEETARRDVGAAVELLAEEVALM